METRFKLETAPRFQILQMMLSRNIALCYFFFHGFMYFFLSWSVVKIAVHLAIRSNELFSIWKCSKLSKQIISATRRIFQVAY